MGPKSQSRDAAAPQLWTVTQLLSWTTDRFARAGLDSPRSDAQHLLAHALGCERFDLYVRFEDIVSDDERASFRELVKRRLQREPVALIEGRKGFHALGLDLAVTRGVLIPRPETEHLVDWVLADLRPLPAPPTSVVDVGTGSGAIALAIKHARSDVDVTATEIDPAALAVARENAATLGLDVTLVQADLLTGVSRPADGWTVVAANLPYIPSRDLAGLPPEIREFEPRRALEGGVDGLDVIRTLIEQVAEPGVLAADGSIYLEVGAGQAHAVAELLGAHSFVVERREDLAGIERVVRGVRPSG